MQEITSAKRKRLLKTFGSYPAGYTHDDLERLLDLLYGMFSDVYTRAELRQIVVSDPFDRSEHPRHSNSWISRTGSKRLLPDVAPCSLRWRSARKHRCHSSIHSSRFF